MIIEALHHIPGIGPAQLAKLHAAGIRNWCDLLACEHDFPPRYRKQMVAECQRCVEAEKAGDVRYFVDRLKPVDKWRILERFRDSVTYFDIETEGLDNDARVTVIACWHRGALRTFVEHENLDGFLELLDEIRLLASFNGSSFDVPRMLDAFHIPELPCPHVDLRWMCHHRGWKGGLKEISAAAGIARPADLEHANGALAVQLWSRWIACRDESARHLLLRYCGADVVLLPMLAHCLLGGDHVELAHLWKHLPAVPTDEPPQAVESPPDLAGVQRENPRWWGGPDRLRAWRSRNPSVVSREQPQ